MKKCLVILAVLACLLCCGAGAVFAAEETVIIPGGEVPENNHPITNETPISSNPFSEEEGQAALLFGIAAGTLVISAGYAVCRILIGRKSHEKN